MKSIIRIFILVCLLTAGSRLSAQVVSNESGATVTTTSSVVLATNAKRLNVTIVNYGTTACFLSMSGTATAAQGIWVGPNGGSYNMDSGNLYVGAISAICASGTTTLTVQEGAKQ